MVLWLALRKISATCGSHVRRRLKLLLEWVLQTILVRKGGSELATNMSAAEKDHEIEEALAGARRIKAGVSQQEIHSIDRAATVDLSASRWPSFDTFGVATPARKEHAAGAAEENARPEGSDLCIKFSLPSRSCRAATFDWDSIHRPVDLSIVYISLFETLALLRPEGAQEGRGHQEGEAACEEGC